ncbi:MAG TPA: BTAD domain-containing putative transcriptional regulator [Candidatus Tumulicola sp.]|jgi:DNA-binding SARP family transcriptional activator
MISYAPRLAPSVIRRPRLEDWIGRFKSVPVRLLIAPAGFGKTTAIISYLRHCEGRGLYCGLRRGATAADVWAAIGAAIQAECDLGDVVCASAEDVLRALGACAPVELALDCNDTPDADGLSAIASLIDQLPDGVSLLFAARSRAALDVGRLVADGMAALCDSERLAFDATEVRHLADACSVAHAGADAGKMIEASDGWPLVVSGAIRKAAEDGCDLPASLENWRNRYGHFFTEYISAALENAPENEAAIVRQMMAGSTCRDVEKLEALEMEGLFVIHDARGYRSLRALSRLRASHRSVPSRLRSAVPLHVRMFGRFQADLDQHPIEWVRRRDQQIFKFVALSRDGTVSRSELAQTFWPNAEKHLVAQSLRTACCNIRKAIANVVGTDAVDNYFLADGDVSLNLNNVIIDIRRFSAHANDGDVQYAHNELRAAYAHYRTAEQLYYGSLLLGESEEPWFATQARDLDERNVAVLERLAEIAIVLGDYGAAANHARRVSEIKPESEAARRVLTQLAQRARFHDVTPIPLTQASPQSTSTPLSTSA